jgi:protein Mpv17
MASVLKAIDAACARRPLTFACAISTVKAVLADEFVQRVVEGRSAAEVDRTRTAVFAAFGLAYCGVGQHFIYGRFYPWLVAGIGSNTKRALATLAFDQSLQVPFIYYPSFYIAQEIITAKNNGRQIQAKHAYDTWQGNIQVDLAACASFWIPANGFNFLVMPIHWRVPYIAVVGLGWLSLLSWLRGNNRPQKTNNAADIPAANAG